MKKNLLTVLVLALTLVNTILIGVMMVSVMGTNKKTAKLVGDIATVLNFELGPTSGDEEKEQVSLADTEVYAINGQMTILLKNTPGSTKSTYIVCDIALSLNKKHADYKKYGADFASYESMVKSAINDAVMQYTEIECRNDMTQFKADILKAVQDVFHSDFVYSISLSGVKFG